MNRCIASFAATLAIFTLATTGCSQEPDSTSSTGGSSSSAIQVEVQSIITETLTERRRWAGRLEPLQNVVVRAPHRGAVEGLEVREGDIVEADQRLLRISGPAAHERRTVLDERVDHLREELARWERLATANAAGPAEVNEAKLRLLDAEQQQAELSAEFTGDVVRAPFAGRIALKHVSSGANILAGEDLFIIDNANSIGVELQLPSTETKYLERSENVTVYDDDKELSIERIVYGSDPHAGFATARLYLAGVADDRRRRIEVIYEAHDEILIVPWTAVASDDDEYWVAVVDGESLEIERRLLELGRAHEAGIEVLHGLEAGELVVRYEPRHYNEGESVAIVESRR